MAAKWLVRTATKDRGPYSLEKMRELVDAGRVKRNTLVSRDGENWVKAWQIKGLRFPKNSTRRPKPDADADQPADHVPWYEGMGRAERARARLGQSRAASERGERPMSGTEKMLLRLRYCGIIALIAAGLTYGIVRLLRVFGVLVPSSVAGSLAVRIGTPLLIFAATFAFLFWRTTLFSGDDIEIDAEMTDEEIAEALKRR